MKLTKLMMLGLALGTAGTLATAVQADTTSNPDGSQTVDNSKEPVDTTADIKATVLLGFDNTNPETPEPGDKDKWINISLPTEALSYSDESNDHKTITSPNYTIKNNSARPVKVSVSNYSVSGNVSNIDSLSLNPTSAQTTSPVSLITGGSANTVFGQDLMTLASPSADTSAGDYNDTGVTDTFSFSGATSSDWLLTDLAPEKMDATLSLSFTPLDEKGDEYPNP